MQNSEWAVRSGCTYIWALSSDSSSRSGGWYSMELWVVQYGPVGGMDLRVVWICVWYGKPVDLWYAPVTCHLFTCGIMD